MKVDASNGMTYAPKGKPAPVVKPGEFIFSAAHLDHGHIYGMTNALLEAGGTLKYVYDRDPNRLANFIKTYPQSFAVMSQVGEVVGNFKNLSSSGKEVASMLDSGDGKTL